MTVIQAREIIPPSPRDEAERLYAIGWRPEVVRRCRVGMKALNGWTDEQVEECAEILEGMIG